MMTDKELRGLSDEMLAELQVLRREAERNCTVICALMGKLGVVSIDLTIEDAGRGPICFRCDGDTEDRFTVHCFRGDVVVALMESEGRRKQ